MSKTPEYRKCRKCSAEKPLADFPLYRKPDGRRHECHACYKARHNAYFIADAEGRRAKARQHYAANRSTSWTPEKRQRHNENANRHRIYLRELVYAEYGDRCVCCGESNPLFLTLDHVENDGHKVRVQQGVSSRLYRWAIQNGFPDSLQLLCYNCNMGKARNGGVCPHKGRFNDYGASQYAASARRKRPAPVCE